MEFEEPCSAMFQQIIEHKHEDGFGNARDIKFLELVISNLVGKVILILHRI